MITAVLLLYLDPRNVTSVPFDTYSVSRYATDFVTCSACLNLCWLLSGHYCRTFCERNSRDLCLVCC